MPDCGSTTAAPSVRICTRSIAGTRNRRHRQGLGTLYTWNVLSPRLGVTPKLTADGRTILRASYGRFSQGVLTGEIGLFHPGVTPITTTGFDPATGGYTRPVSVVDPKINLQLDRDTRAPHTDEYSVGVDRELGRRLAVAIAYVRKDGANFIGWTDVGGQYREDTRTLTDGRTVPVFVLANTTRDRRFLLTNPDDYSMTYNGLVLVVEKRRSDGWQAFGSYTFSRTSGLQPSSGTTAAGAQVSTIAPPPVPQGVTFGRDPNDLTNARGRLPNDRPAHLPRDGQRRRATNRPGDCRPTAVLQRQAVGGDGTGRVAAVRRLSASCSNRAARADCRRKRCSMCACRGRSLSAGRDVSSCSWTCSTCSTTPPKKGWSRKTCSARISVYPPRSSIPAER